MFYIAKTPNWVKKLFTGSIWEMPGADKTIYLTFDDGPHPQVTPFVLEELRKYNASATFFCIGKNVEANPQLFERLIREGHAVGNHTHNHLDGWKTEKEVYVQNIVQAGNLIKSNLFRPPYGRITRSQHKALTQKAEPFKVVMWSVLSGDFDVKITPEQCCRNVIKNAKSGAVIVFHDSEKANEKLRFTLPAVLKYFSEKGYRFKKMAFDV